MSSVKKLAQVVPFSITIAWVDYESVNVATSYKVVWFGYISHLYSRDRRSSVYNLFLCLPLPEVGGGDGDCFRYVCIYQFFILSAGSLLNQAARQMIPFLDGHHWPMGFETSAIPFFAAISGTNLTCQVHYEPGPFLDGQNIGHHCMRMGSETSAIPFCAAVSWTNLTCRVHSEPGCPRPRMGWPRFCAPGWNLWAQKLAPFLSLRLSQELL